VISNNSEVNVLTGRDCLLILLSISVFLLFSFSVFHILVVGFVR